MQRLLMMGVMVLTVAGGLTPVATAQAPAQTTRAAEQVDLNRATAEQLEALPGIGPRMAERIIEYREANGGFEKVEDLMNVSGIGEATFLRLRPLVTVSAPAPSGGDRD